MPIATEDSQLKRDIQSRLDVAPERVVFTPFMVDAEFSRPDRANKESAVLPETVNKTSFMTFLLSNPKHF